LLINDLINYNSNNAKFNNLISDLNSLMFFLIINRIDLKINDEGRTTS